MPRESPELIHSKDPSRKTSKPVLSNTVFYDILRKMENYCVLAGHPEDKEGYKLLADSILERFNDKYFDAEKGCYDNNTVTANILALHLGMVPEGHEEDVMRNIVEKTENDWGGHVSAGVVGIQHLMRGLTEYGQKDLAFRIASADTYPSWGYMIRNGATTIWELWNGNTADPSMNSMNHVMMIGDFLIWDYEYLAGIRAAEPGYTKILLEPWPIEGLDWVKCSWQAPTGKIVSNWTVKDGVFDWDVEVPVRTEIHLPDGSRRDVDAGKHHFSVTL
jgi:alpha-L-rhamnosidase